jgi:hypothetical protein
MIFEFHYKSNNIKDWIKAPSRKEAIYFIISETDLTFGDIIKGCKIRKLSTQEEKDFMVHSGDNTTMSFQEYSKTVSETDYIASTAFYCNEDSLD